MRRLVVAVSEFLEAKAELLREEAGGIALGMYARGFKDAMEDCHAAATFTTTYPKVTDP